jgi:hypothetical protein
MRFAAGLILAAALVSPETATAAETCTSKPMTAIEAKQLQDLFYDALTREDVALWGRLTTSDFVAFENGRPYDAKGFFDLVAGAHKAGTALKWSVADEKVEIACNLAVMRYVNVGSVTRAGEALRPTKWLETTAFRRVGDGWRVFLVTSTTVRD